MRKYFILTALVAGFSVIGGTGHAAPQAMLYAYVVDHGTTTSVGRCEDIAGADRAACRKLESIVADANRNAALDALSKDWKGPKLAAFARLVAAEQAFAQALAANETSATPGSSEVADAQQAENDVFVATLQRLVAGKLLFGSSLTETDDALNDAYGRVMKVDDPKELGWGDVDKSGILRTERAWIAYRDAFATFAATLDSPGAAEAIRSELTRQRTASLDSFLGD